MSLNEVECRLAVVEAQLGRIVSDIESEKRTRADSNSEVKRMLSRIDDRLRHCEWLIAIGAGAVALMKLLL